MPDVTIVQSTIVSAGILAPNPVNLGTGLNTKLLKFTLSAPGTLLDSVSGTCDKSLDGVNFVNESSFASTGVPADGEAALDPTYPWSRITITVVGTYTVTAIVSTT